MGFFPLGEDVKFISSKLSLVYLYLTTDLVSWTKKKLHFQKYFWRQCVLITVRLLLSYTVNVSLLWTIVKIFDLILMI